MFSPRSKLLALASVAALAMPQGIFAQPSSGSSSSFAFCRVTASSSAFGLSQDAVTNDFLDIGHYVCGDMATNTTIVNIDQQVEDVAVAIAAAFAEVSASCSASGDAEVRAQAYAMAEDRAEAIGTAVTEIFAVADVCDFCTAAVSALATTTKELVAVALAEAWTDMYLFSDSGTTVSNTSTVTSNIVQTTISTVLSSITGVIRAGANDGCSLDIINSAQVGDYVASCELSVSGDDIVVEVDAMATAGAEASAYACDGDIATSEVDVIAKATARALARAVAQADIYCETVGGDDTMACGLAEAEAFASAFAEAETCGCNVSAQANASVFEDIWVEAVTNAYAETCSAGNGDAFATEFNTAVSERMLTATARAVAEAVAVAEFNDTNSCRVSANPCSSASEFCVAVNGICGGTSSGFEDVKPCCGDDYRCVVQSERRFVCRHRSAFVPSFWDGRIEECTLGLADSL